MIQHPRLIIIDDDPSYRQPIATHLAKDFQVVEATCGQEGLSRMLTMRPELVIFGMPLRSCDGLQTLRTISTNARMSEVLLMLLATPPADINDLRSRGFHVDDLMVKDRSIWKSITPRLLALLSKKAGSNVTGSAVPLSSTH